MPLISAILPTFNRVERLKVRIQEVINQTEQDWELIIVNDCSTDGTYEFLTSLKDQRIKVINLEINSGCVTIPRNIGISHCSGKFICHLDDDVVNLPNKFKLLSEPLITYPKAVLCYGDRITRYEETGQETIHEIPSWNPLSGPAVDNGQIMYRNLYYDIPLVFCTRACDWELAKVLRSKGPFIHIKEIVSIYLWHKDNRSLDPNTKTKPLNIELFNPFFKDKKLLIV